MDDEEIRLIFLEFIFFHFAVKNKIYPELSKDLGIKMQSQYGIR